MAETRSILIVNGPNLNLLGVRNPAVYGTDTLAKLMEAAASRARELGLMVEARQSNHEGDIVTWIQAARQEHAAIVINPAAFTHTSVAIPDALEMFEGPIVEVHLSNIYAREPWRHHSHVSRVARGMICGMGGHGYVLAVEAVARMLKSAKA